MAIKKTKNFSNGSSGNYWRITSVLADLQGMGSYTVSLYRDEDFRESGGDPMFVQTIPVTIPKDTLMQGNVLEYLYLQLVASNIIDGVETNWFADSEPAMADGDDFHIES